MKVLKVTSAHLYTLLFYFSALTLMRKQSAKYYLTKPEPGSISATLLLSTFIVSFIVSSVCLSDQEGQLHFYRNWLWTTTARATGQEVEQVYTISSSLFLDTITVIREELTQLVMHRKAYKGWMYQSISWKKHYSSIWYITFCNKVSIHGNWKRCNL